MVRHGHCVRGKKSRMSPTYKAWQNMIARCENPNSASFSYYSERGISVCERWHKFENFLQDMGAKPDGLSLDRVDNNGNYEPENCRWATHSQQMFNKRNTFGSLDLRNRIRTMLSDGMRQCDVARELGLKKSYIADVVRRH